MNKNHTCKEKTTTTYFINFIIQNLQLEIFKIFYYLKITFKVSFFSSPSSSSWGSQILMVDYRANQS